MFNLLLRISALFALANSSGEFTILHYPDSIEFKGHETLKESLLPEVFSASLGLTTEKDSNWRGLYLNDPFDLAENVFTVAVDGIATLEINKGHYYPLTTDADESEIFASLESRIVEHNPRDTNRLLRVDLSQGDTSAVYELFKNKIGNQNDQYNYLNTDSEEDRRFVEELQVLKAVAAALELGTIDRENLPKVLWLKLGSLHALSDVYGQNSSVLQEAKQLLSKTLLTITSSLKKLFSGRVLVTVITSDASHTRRSKRQVARDESDLNLAKTYSEDYPVIFNIILWFCVVFFFSLLAISVYIADMDPGRDSIIYRMTSTRMKKDN